MRVVGAWAVAGAAVNFGLAWLMWGDRGQRTRATLARWMGIQPVPVAGSDAPGRPPPTTATDKDV